MISSEDALRKMIAKSYEEEFGITDPDQVEKVLRDWLDDRKGQSFRFLDVEKTIPGAKRILDMASGCGTAVFHGLHQELDIYGLEPDIQKQELLRRWIDESGYPKEWIFRFHLGVGEALPYRDNTFDCIMSFQTLEHVNDPEGVLREMLRVTRSGGGIQILCPDYSGTFEGHYLLPWLPLLPRPVAKIYLRLLRRPLRGFNGINYVTGRNLKKSIRKIADVQKEWRVELIDGRYRHFKGLLKRFRFPNLPGLYFAYATYDYLRRVFREDWNVWLFVLVRKNDSC